MVRLDVLSALALPLEVLAEEMGLLLNNPAASALQLIA